MIIFEGKHTGTLSRKEFSGAAHSDEEKILKFASGIID